mmetsp:Transcript_5632/g.17325  ORF Transcript_5632/g.17325 Transcript_5632/m.17325 type:complete len:84 (-) Transcript_5632:94-345(-)
MNTLCASSCQVWNCREVFEEVHLRHEHATASNDTTLLLIRCPPSALEDIFIACATCLLPPFPADSPPSALARSPLHPQLGITT